MPTILSAELALELDCDLGEGPFWDEAKQELYFVDITNKQVKIFSPSDSSSRTIQFSQEVSAVILDQNSELIVAARVLFMWKMVAMSQVCLIFPYPQYNFLFQPGK